MRAYWCATAVCLSLCIPDGTAARAAFERADELARGFSDPPASSRPHTFWHWMNGNVTKEGITADLEAMKQIGIGGVFQFQVEGQIVESVPVYIDPPVRHLTPQWFEMIRHAATECKRLGLEFSIMNCTGWSTSGGPWVPPEESMMRVAWSEKYVKGPGPVRSPLPQPPCDFAQYQNLTSNRAHIHESVPPERRFYRDMAVLAYPLEPSTARTAALWPPQATSNAPGANLAMVIDGIGQTAQALPADGFIEFNFGEAVVVRGVEYLGSSCELQASDDGKTWRVVAALPGPRQNDYPQTLPVPETKARRFRLFHAKGGSVSDIKLSGDAMVFDYQDKASFHGPWTDIRKAEDRIGSPTPDWAAATIRSKDVLDLTQHLRPDGTLDWTAPSGDWMIVRIGCAPVGRLNAPCGREFAGLECDKLDAAAVEHHFNRYAGRVADRLKDLIGTGFHAVHVDSWEAGDTNFTPKFIEEFKMRRGYDPAPFLLVHGGGRVVDSPDISDRFLWDVRRTIADLLADNYYGKLQELCHKRGLKFQGEIAGALTQTTVDQLQVKGRCDLPMGEFQTFNCVYGGLFSRWDARETACGAHIHGRPIAGAEAFVCFDNWTTDPYGLKGIGDLAFAMGINRLVFHTFAHDPWPTEERVPGMTMGPFGVNFSRKDTWWGRPAKAWIDYLRRCSFMLQQGQFVGDILYFYGEGTPNTLPTKEHIDTPWSDGYSYDGCDAETLLTRVAVKDGRLTLPDGMSYSVLVLKNDARMTPRVLGRIKELVEAGATIVGPKPISSPSLAGYPKCDDEVKRLADELWGNIDGKTVTEKAHGKGLVFSGIPVDEVMDKLGIVPNLEFKKIEGVSTVDWIHRRADDVDLYFISNQENISQHGLSHDGLQISYAGAESLDADRDTAQLEIAFRVTGRQPELWDAVTGDIRDLPEFRQADGRTIVPITLPPVGSCFVVFRKPIDQSKSGNGKNYPALEAVATLEGPWDVRFDPKWGGPEKVTFETLDDWTRRSEPGIRNYSGKATYHKKFDAPQAVRQDSRRVWLELGVLHSTADVRLNGHDLGVLWCPPWRVDVTDLLKSQGNDLEIDVTNVWANRIIGDAALPEDQRFTWTSATGGLSTLKPTHPLSPSGLRGPVRLLVEER